MRLTRPRRKPGATIFLTPLIDVVLLLIIFSMVVPHFAKLRAERLDLPEARQGQPAEDEADGQVVINVLPDGRLVVLGQPRTTAALEAMLADEAKRRGAGNVSVVLRGDRAAAWPAAAGVLKLCGRRGITRVKVAVTDAPSGSGGGGS